MIITLGGHLGAGKSTLGKKLAEHFSYRQYSTGGLMREMASDRWVSIIELNQIAEKDGGAFLFGSIRVYTIWNKINAIYNLDHLDSDKNRLF
jgi:adenylate kinase family enzyme